MFYFLITAALFCVLVIYCGLLDFLILSIQEHRVRRRTNKAFRRYFRPINQVPPHQAGMEVDPREGHGYYDDPHDLL